MAEQLKPCPFCGGDKIHLVGYDAASGRKTAPECWVACGTCGATSNTSSFPENATSYWNARPEAAQVRVEDLDERMKAAGMIPLSELLESQGPMEKFKQHAAVKTLDDFVWWIKSQQKQFMTMRMQYELGDKDKGDDLFEWVFAHAAVYDQVATQLRALEPDTVTGWQDISTAPKDGTRVMLSYDDFVTTGRYWDAWNDGTADWFDDSDDVLCGYLEPTHWMPLPPAPEKEG